MNSVWNRRKEREFGSGCGIGGSYLEEKRVRRNERGFFGCEGEAEEDEGDADVEVEKGRGRELSD